MNAVRIPVLLLSLCAVLSTGCFSVKHRLPPHAYFGSLPAAPGEHSSHFERSAMKNWLPAVSRHAIAIPTVPRRYGRSFSSSRIV